MNKIYGFEGEVRSKLSETFVELFAEVFCCLPLAHVINEKVFVVHGGLFSVDGVKLSDIRAIDRFCEPPEEGKLQHGVFSLLFLQFMQWSVQFFIFSMNNFFLLPSLATKLSVCIYSLFFICMNASPI